VRESGRILKAPDLERGRKKDHFGLPYLLEETEGGRHRQEKREFKAPQPGSSSSITRRKKELNLLLLTFILKVSSLGMRQGRRLRERRRGRNVIVRGGEEPHFLRAKKKESRSLRYSILA